jgi:hypothetical protein
MLKVRRGQVKVESEIFDPISKKAALHLSSTAITPLGQYGNEYAVFLSFTEDGSQITRFEEMVDSAYSEKFFKELRGHLQNHGGDSAAAWEHATTG